MKITSHKLGISKPQMESPFRILLPQIHTVMLTWPLINLKESCSQEVERSPLFNQRHLLYTNLKCIIRLVPQHPHLPLLQLHHILPIQILLVQMYFTLEDTIMLLVNGVLYPTSMEHECILMQLSFLHTDQQHSLFLQAQTELFVQGNQQHSVVVQLDQLVLFLTGLHQQA